MEQEAASRRYIEWSKLEENLATEEKPSGRVSTERPPKHREYAEEPKAHGDLIVAGRKLFGPAFKFRDNDQQWICNEVYLSGHPSIAVQAPTGCGKTELFRLPLAALASKKSCKHVSFVFVPFTLLVAGTLQRLCANKLLKGNDVKSFIASGYDGLTDVYVGVHEDLAKEELAERIIGFESANGSEVKLSHLVIDEFHAFETEKYRQGQLSKIGQFRFDAFEKVLFLRATAAPKRIGFKGLELGERGEAVAEDHSKGMTSYRTKFFDLVTELPLQHVHKTIIQKASTAREAFVLLKALFRCEPNAPAVVAVDSKPTTEQLALEWEHDFKIVWMHSGLEDQKTNRAHEFLGDETNQVLLGTKMVTEGIDVPILKINRIPTSSYQAAVWLRSAGMLYLLPDKRYKQKSDNPDLPPIDVKSLDEDVARFYGLDTKVYQPQEETEKLVERCKNALEFVDGQTEVELRARFGVTRKRAA